VRRRAQQSLHVLPKLAKTADDIIAANPVVQHY
jgi:hypothetical protein